MEAMPTSGTPQDGVVTMDAMQSLMSGLAQQMGRLDSHKRERCRSNEADLGQRGPNAAGG